MGEGVVRIKKFVQEALSEIQESVPKDFLIGNINFEVAVTASTKKRGGVNLQVLSAGASATDQTTHKIAFSVSSKKASAHAMKQFEKFLTTLQNLDKVKKKRRTKRKKRTK